jgi:hypothetical protein
MKTKTLRQRISNAPPEAKMTRYRQELRRRRKTERQNRRVNRRGHCRGSGRIK